MPYADPVKRREHSRLYMRKWRAAHPDRDRSGRPPEVRIRTDESRMKDAARAKLARAIKRGEVVRPDECDDCGGVGRSGWMQAHHDDYAKPYAVRWLCSACHGLVHRMPDGEVA